MSETAQTGILTVGSAVNLKNVCKQFVQKQSGKLFRPSQKIIRALDNVSFSIDRGEFIAYAGPNGAGKSTTIKLLAGMLRQNSGEIEVLGMSPLRHRIPLMREVGVLLGNRTELWWDHPVSSSYRWKRAVWDIPKKVYEEMEDLVLDLLDIRPFYNTFARELSLGQRMRADLGMMLLHRPSLILLDEPTLGLDVLAKRGMINFLRQYNETKSATIIVTSHDIDDLEEMARRILLISSGKIAFDGDFSELRDTLALKKKAIISTKDGQRHEIDHSDLGAWLREIPDINDVVDIAFSQTPLEEGIATLYQSWRE